MASKYRQGRKYRTMQALITDLVCGYNVYWREKVQAPGFMMSLQLRVVYNALCHGTLRVAVKKEDADQSKHKVWNPKEVIDA